METASYARGINNSGNIVGESDSADQKRAFLYTKNQLVELDRGGNSSEAGFKSLDVAYGINDKGSIVGYGTTSDHLKAAFIAVPEGRDTSGVSGSTPQPQAQQKRDRPTASLKTQPGTAISESLRMTMTSFIRGYPPTKAIGWRPAIMVTVSDPGSQRIGDLTRRSLGLDRSRVVLGLQRAFWLGNVPLRPMGQHPRDRVVLGSRKSMGPGLGLMEGKCRERRLGSSSPRSGRFRATTDLVLVRLVLWHRTGCLRLY